MRKVLLIIAIAAIACSCGPKAGYVIDGRIDGLGVPMVYMSDSDGGVIDSAVVSDGKFRFEGAAETPSIAYIDEQAPNESLIMVILENGRIKVTGNMEEPGSIRATGTPSNNAYNEFMTLSGNFSDRFANAETDEEMDAIMGENDAAIMRTIDSNTTNYFGLALLANMAISLEGDEVLSILGKFTPELQATELAGTIREGAEAMKRIAIGQPYTDIVLPDKDGNQVALSSFIAKGNYVLIDFWASWCIWCIKEVPYMIDTYNTYHSKGFEIYGISFDLGEEAETEWLDAIKDNKMNWVQVAAFKVPDNTVAKDYAITAYPTNFLISPEGIIVAKNLRGDDLKKEIAKYLD